MLFHILDECFVITRNRGVFRQAKVFVRGEHVYAAHGNGFVRLMGHGGTTVPTMVWEGLSDHPGVQMRLGGAPKYGQPAIGHRREAAE